MNSVKRQTLALFSLIITTYNQRDMSTNNYIKIRGSHINTIIFFDGNDTQKSYAAYARAIEVKCAHDAVVPEARKGIDEAHFCLWKPASGIPIEVPLVGESLAFDILPQE